MYFCQSCLPWKYISFYAGFLAESLIIKLYSFRAILVHSMKRPPLHKQIRLNQPVHPCSLFRVFPLCQYILQFLMIQLAGNEGPVNKQADLGLHCLHMG